MAQLPQTQSFRAQVNQAPSAVAPGVSFGQQRPDLAYESQAQYQGTVSKVLDRMSSAIFGVAQDQSQRAGLQFAAENPLTATQLRAMATGDSSELDLGNPLNVFNNAVRKARAIEVSAHAEIEGRDKLVELLKKAESGEIDTGAIRDQVAAITNGYGEALAQIDPEASYKYRATMATIGSKVIDKVAELEGKKRLIANRTKLDRLYQNMQKEISLYASSEPPINPETGLPMSLDMITDSLKQNFLNNALTLGGVNAADTYIARIDKDITDAKVNAITQHVITDEAFTSDPNAIKRMQMGDAGRATAAYQTLLPEDRTKVMAAFMTADANKYTFTERARKEQEIKDKNTALDLYEQWLVAKDGGTKRSLQQKLLDLNVLTFEQTKNLIEGEGTTNPNVLFHIEDQIDNGQITNSTDLMAEATRRGVSGQALVQLRRRMSEKVSPQVKSMQKQIAGFPEGLGAIIDPKSAEFREYMSIQERRDQARSAALAAGKPFDEYAWTRELQREKEEKLNTADAKSARDTLKNVYEKRAGGPITSSTLPYLEEKVRNGKSEIKPRELEEIKKLVLRAEGKQ